MSRTEDFWPTFFLGMADYVSQASKDPSTRCGAVIVRPDRTVASVGYNGFPRGVVDDETRLNNRETKLSMTVHAEMNAILNAHERMDGYTIYVTGPCCSNCAAAVIQAGIKHVIYKKPDDDFLSRWKESCHRADVMFCEAGVAVNRKIRDDAPSQASSEFLLDILSGSHGRLC